MRIVVLSDTHLVALPRYKLVGDLLIHAGDFYDQSERSDRELVRLNGWFAKQDFATKIYIPGNHDFPVWESWRDGSSRLTEAKLLVDEAITYEGLTLYGSPWVTGCGMAFHAGEEEIASRWERIPEATDILVTHMPPYHILDSAARTGSLGCPRLAERVFQIAPKLHVFGHVHASHGTARIGATTFVNASQCYDGNRARPIHLSI